MLQEQQPASHFHNAGFSPLFIALLLCDLFKHFKKPHVSWSSGREWNKHTQSKTEGSNSKQESEVGSNK